MIGRRQKLAFIDFPLCAKCCISHYPQGAFDIHEVYLIELGWNNAYVFWWILENLWSVIRGVILWNLTAYTLYISESIMCKALCKVEGGTGNRKGRLMRCRGQTASQFGSLLIGLSHSLPLHLLRRACYTSPPMTTGQGWSLVPVSFSSQQPSVICLISKKHAHRRHFRNSTGSTWAGSILS